MSADLLLAIVARNSPAFNWVNLGIGAAGTDFGETAQPSPDGVFGPYRLDPRGIQVGKQVPVVRYRYSLREVVCPEELASAV